MDMDVFKEQLLSYFKNKGELPNVEFKSNTSLASIVDQIIGSGTSYVATVEDSEQLQNFIDDVVKTQDDEFLGKKIFGELDEIVETFTGYLKSARGDLTDIKTCVESLVNQINDANQKIIASDAFLRTHIGSDNSKPEYNEINWNDVALMGNEAAIKQHIQEMASVRDDTIMRTGFTRIHANLPLNNSRATTVINTVKFKKDIKKGMVDHLSSKLNAVLRDEVLEVVNTLFEEKKFKRFARSIADAYTEQKNFGSHCVEMLSAIRTYKPVMDLMRSGELTLTHETTQKLENNIAIAEEYLKAAAYYVLECRSRIFNESIMLDNKMLNPDVYPDFKEDGGESTDLANYLEYMHSSLPLPGQGITLADIAKRRQDLRDRAETEAAKKASQLKLRANQAISSAMKGSFREFVKSKKIDVDKNIDVEALSDKVARQHVINDAAIEDSAYDFIIEASHRNSFVESLYRNLGRAYVKAMEATSELSEEDIERIELGVAVDLFLDFLCPKFMEALAQ